MMNLVRGRGDLIAGEWRLAAADRGVVETHDPARDFAQVFAVPVDVGHVDDAVAAARAAQRGWWALSFAERRAHLASLEKAFQAHVDDIAEAIVRETGKPQREALGEARSLAARVALVAGDGMRRVEPLLPEGVDGEARAHPQGVVAVIGPYNYPAHLVNAHVIPALLTGNTVVMKPSEQCAWTGELYALCFQEAGLPPGVVNMVQGAGEVGRALVGHPGTDAILFTGSWATGRAITEACLDQPHKLVALEMGGKNCAVVLEDADLTQALAAVLQGAFLTTGQRCTATSRVLVHEAVADRFIEALASATRELTPGDPWLETTAFGPLANRVAFERFCEMRRRPVSLGLEALVPGRVLPGGGFVTPSVHFLPEGHGDPLGYLDEELFGPDICVETISGVDHAINRLNASPFGLSNSVFTPSRERFERFFRETKSGLLNHNRSTNGASGKLPFGGVGKSGNQRPAGIDAVRYTTFPVAILRGDNSDANVEAPFADAFGAGRAHLELDAAHLWARHRLEATLARYRLPIDDVRGATVLVPQHRLRQLDLGNAPLDPQVFANQVPGAHLDEHHLLLEAPHPDDEAAFNARLFPLLEEIVLENPIDLTGLPSQRVRRPLGGVLPRSAALLRRMYRGDFVPRERKTPVIEHARTEGAYLRSVDDDPLVILDAASQIATLGLGFQSGPFLRGLDEGALGALLCSNPDTTAPFADVPEAEDFARFLTDCAWEGVKHATFTAGGSEANERAFDLCRLHGPGGTRVIAFEGSFHGRTLASLHATWNPTKRAAFEMPGYTAGFVPFPSWADPREEPPVPDGWVASWARGETPAVSGRLIESEVASLEQVRAEVQKGDACCVIVEPFQGEGGDNYGTARFFQGLRALTRHLGVPLVFDEVQSGFGLSGNFYWHDQFELVDEHGAPDGPDCITLAKKAQLGVCLSTWADPRPSPAHVVQAVRGHLHAQAILETNVRHELEPLIRERLWALAVDYPSLLMNPRNTGYAFAFDLPSNHLAQQVIAQRFYRGFMAYIAGERTVRFRLNAAWTSHELDELFAGITAALEAIRLSARDAPVEERRAAMDTYQAPAWEDAPPPMGRRARFSGEYERLRKDRPALLAWLLALPRGPLERVCDRVLYIENQLDDDVVDVALGRLLGGDASGARPAAILEALRTVQQEVATAARPADVYATWEERLGVGPARLLMESIGARVGEIARDGWLLVRDDVLAIEQATYEDGRRDSEDELRAMVEGEGALSLMLGRRTDHGAQRVLGYAFGGPVEAYTADGPSQDPMRGRGNTFYSSNITIDARERGAGLGLRLKREQVRRVAALENDDGSARYHFVSGRNRVGRTREMAGINRAFGAYPVVLFRGNQYGDVSGEALYYRIPLRRPLVTTGVPPRADGGAVIDWASGVQAPLGKQPTVIRDAVARGDFNGPVGTKLTLSNFITPDVVRYTEMLRSLAPRGLPHAYFTSGQAELVDKGIRCLRVGRPGADVVVGLERQFVGTTTAAARSLTDPTGQQQPFGWYDWPRVPHPAEAGAEATLGAILATVNRVGPARVLGVVVELVGEKSGLTLPEGFFEDLCAIRQDTGIPIVAVETASALGRASGRLFESDAFGARPSMVWWYCGGQLGHIFCDSDTWVAKPLTLISTWDGDEISLLRTRHHLEAAWQQRGDDRAARFESAVRAAVGDRAQVTGKGLYLSLHVDDEAARERLLERARERGLQLGRGLGARVLLVPPIDIPDDEVAQALTRLVAALEER